MQKPKTNDSSIVATFIILSYRVKLSTSSRSYGSAAVPASRDCSVTYASIFYYIRHRRPNVHGANFRETRFGSTRLVLRCCRRQAGCG
jgi:hypothetical protein